MQKKLSSRLKNVADLVPAGAVVADIGSDHAYVPVSLLQENKIKYAIAGEVARGPLNNALSVIAKNKMESAMEGRLGDGLAVINPEDQVSAVVIAGMGGELLSEILERGKANLINNPVLILQPNLDEAIVRKWLMENNYEIEEERIILDAGHFYEMMMAKRVKKQVRYSQKELYFGPQLFKQKDEVFRAKWSKRLKNNEAVIHSLENAQRPPLSKIQQLRQIDEELEDILNDKG